MALKILCGAGSLLTEILVQLASLDGVLLAECGAGCSGLRVWTKSGTLRADSKAASRNPEFVLQRKLACLTDWGGIIASGRDELRLSKVNPTSVSTNQP